MCRLLLSPTLGVVQPNRNLLPRMLAEQLAAQLRHAGLLESEPHDPPSLGIGARVVETWTLPSGVDHDLTYNLLPGSQNADAEDVAGRRHSTIIRPDSEGHVVLDPQICPYCHRESCRLCHYGLTECSCCRQPVCKVCLSAQPDLLCQACAHLTRANVVERVRRKRLPAGATLYIAGDQLHTVEVEFVSGRWKARHIPSIGTSSDHTIDPVTAERLITRAGKR